MAEYDYNNCLHSTVKMIPSIANYDYYPQMNWPTAEPSRNPSSHNVTPLGLQVYFRDHTGLFDNSTMDT